LKVLNINNLLDAEIGGGTAERTFQMSRFLAKAGVETTVLTTSIGLTRQRKIELKGVSIIALSTLMKRFFIPKPSFQLIRNTIKKADIIHIMNHWTFLNALVYINVRFLKKPYVVCPAGALPIFGRSRFIKKIYNWIIGGKIIRDASGHVAIAVNEIEHFHKYGVEADKVFLIPNGINIEDFHADDSEKFRLKYRLYDNPFLMFIGRLNSIKGPDLLLQAFININDKFNKMHLVFAGPDGGMLSELKDLVANSELNDRVHFLGYIGGSEKSQAYHAAELVVIPSRQEAMSIVVLESGITGTPVLITDQCGFDEVERVGGGKVIPATVEGIQKGLIEILEDPEKLKSSGEKLKKYTFENFTWEAVIQRYLSLYQHLLKTKN
jgi:glycosyltransferase involved in cell wall biosynthesis